MTIDRPTFLVLGAVKAGTTTLHHLLGRHPEVFVTPDKEPRFFDIEYERGLAWFWSHYFSRWAGQPAAGEARPIKLVLPFVADRVRQSLPEARFIAILRDPIARAHAHWWMKKCQGIETLDFAAAIEANLAERGAGGRFDGEGGADRWRAGLARDRRSSTLRTYLEGGLYAEQLDRYSWCSDNQLLVLLLEDLVRSPDRIQTELWQFLGVSNIEPLGEIHLNSAERLFGEAAPVMPESIRTWLTSFYRADIDALERRLRRDLSHWRTQA